MESVLKKHRRQISNFKINYGKPIESVETEVFNKEKSFALQETPLHFSQKFATSYINSLKNYDLGASNSKTLLAIEANRTNSSKIKHKFFLPITPTLNKNFMQGLKLNDVQYEGSVFRNTFNSNNENMRKLTHSSNILDRKIKYLTPNFLSTASKEKITIKFSEKNQKKDEIQILSKNKTAQKPVFKTNKKEQIDDITIIDFKLYRTPSLFFNTTQTPIIQKDLVLNEKKLSQNEFLTKEISLKKAKMEFFISQIKLDETPDYNMKEIASFPDSLSYEELEEVRLEFTQEFSLRNYEKLDERLQKLKFFKKFKQITRINILKQCEILEYNANEKIFSEGDYGDLLYVIIKGSVNIRLKRKFHEHDTAPYEIVINSLYDGDHFGDLAMMAIRKSDENQDKISSKRQNLKELTIVDIRAYLQKFYENKNFEYEKNLNSQAFAQEKQLRNSFLGKQNKSYFGLEEKDQKVVRTKRTATIEAAEKSMFLVLKRQKYQNIVLSILQQNLEDKIQTLLQSSIFENFEPYILLPLAYYLKEISYKLGQFIIFQGEPLINFSIISKGRCDSLLEVNKRDFKIRSLEIGDVIGGKCLLSLNELQKKKEIEIIDLKEEMKAKLSIRAESKKVELFYLDKKSFELLPLDLKNEIKQKIITYKEFDDYPVDQIKSEVVDWEKKATKIKSILLKKKLK